MGEIIGYDQEYSKDFKNLNMAWLKEFFYVEPHDEKLLSACKENIIDQGGFIFFYREHKRILGTFALIKIDDFIFELGKMAVEKSQQGNGIGKKLMQHCIAFGNSQGWKKIILYSNRRLENSIHLYEKFGFKEIELEKDNPYDRANIKMEFNLKNCS